mgnify:CR=1 FL=1
MMPPRQGWEALQERLLFLPPLPGQLDPLALFALLLVAGLLVGETLFRRFGLSRIATEQIDSPPKPEQVVGSVLVFPGAVWAERLNLAGSGRRVLRLLAMLPMAVPGLVLGLGYVFVPDGSKA